MVPTWDELRPGVQMKPGRLFTMKSKLNQTTAERLAPRDRAYIHRDQAPPGFGCRVTPNAVRSWVFEYRPGGGRSSSTRRLTIGRVDALPYTKARKTAEALYHRTRLGEDPAGVRDGERAAPTVDTVIERYMREEIGPARKPGTAANYAKLFRNHISPAIGRKRAAEVTYSDVAKLHRAIGTRAQVTANRATSLISSLYTWAGKAGEIPRGTNPARDVSRFREQARTRYLSGEEIARLGDTLTLAETDGLPFEVDDTKPTSKHAPRARRTRLSPHATGAIRLLLLTGCRLGEVLSLRWGDVDFERGLLLLPDSKTGSRPVWLNAAALAVLEELSRIRIGDHVIAGDRPGAPRSDLHRPWHQVVKHAGLEGVTLHTLRHTHASVGVGAGIGLPLVGALLGHRVAATTQRYSHIGHEPARRASETIGATIAAALERRPAGTVVGIRAAKCP
jgi:integrase